MTPEAWQGRRVSHFVFTRIPRFRFLMVNCGSNAQRCYRTLLMATQSPLTRSPEHVKKPHAEPNVLHVVLGNLLIRPWYPSFYPEDLVGSRTERLYVCQWCFRYSRELMPYLAHMVCSPTQLPDFQQLFNDCIASLSSPYCTTSRNMYLQQG